MKILHSADWHLGKSFHNTSLIDDQYHALSQILERVRDIKPDVFILAGDIYDRALPPAEAVQLFDEFINELVLDLGVPLIAIAGNHDSAKRIDYGQKLLKRQGLHIFGSLNQQPQIVTLNDAHGSVDFYPIPYFDPTQIQDADGKRLHSHQAAMQHVLNQIKPTRRSVAIAHAFVTGGIESKSERPLFVGGTESIHADLFKAFNYTALGHLHCPQDFSSHNLRYSGSLLKYSFSETKHEKSISFIELDAQGKIHIEALKLSPKRDVQCVKGSIIERVFHLDPQYQINHSDFLEISLDNTSPVSNAMQIIQKNYPNSLILRWSGIVSTDNNPQKLNRETLQTLAPDALFAQFFQQHTALKMSDKQNSILQASIKTAQQQVDNA